MNNKVKFLRGTSGEYAVAEKDNDTIYFTTDDGKLYIGDKEISGDGSITIDDTLSDTSTNPVQNKVVKQAIDNKADKSLYGDTTINVGRKAGTTVGVYSTAEGHETTASGAYSYAEGRDTTASGTYSHAEGDFTTASGAFSHAEGNNTTASGNCSHAEGCQATAGGRYSHAGGYYTKALKVAEFAHGQYNQSNDNTLFSVGDGTADDARHNAFEITTTGGKLHDKDIATTDLIPTTLPANGGNADTVGGKVPEKIFYDNGLSTDLNGATQSGCYAASPDTLNVPFSTWWLVDTTNFNNQFIVQKAHNIGNSTNTMSYIRNYANDVWSEWKEISTTPIKSTTVSGTTDANGNLMLWAASENKIPICAILTVYFSSIFYYSPNGNYYLGVTDINTHAYSPNVSVGGTVYYIEQG